MYWRITNAISCWESGHKQSLYTDPGPNIGNDKGEWAHTTSWAVLLFNERPLAPPIRCFYPLKAAVSYQIFNLKKWWVIIYKFAIKNN